MKKLNSKKIIKSIKDEKRNIDVIVSFRKITFEEYLNLKFILEKLLKRKVDLIIKQDLRELSYIKKEVEYAKI